MPETTITQLPDPSGFSADPFTDIIRDGARKLIEQAIHAELAALMAAFSEEIRAHLVGVRDAFQGNLAYWSVDA